MYITHLSQMSQSITNPPVKRRRRDYSNYDWPSIISTAMATTSERQWCEDNDIGYSTYKKRKREWRRAQSDQQHSLAQTQLLYHDSNINLNVLSEGVIRTIMTFCTPRDICRLAQVCRQIRDVSSRVSWHDLRHRPLMSLMPIDASPSASAPVPAAAQQHRSQSPTPAIIWHECTMCHIMDIDMKSCSQCKAAWCPEHEPAEWSMHVAVCRRTTWTHSTTQLQAGNVEMTLWDAYRVRQRPYWHVKITDINCVTRALQANRHALDVCRSLELPPVNWPNFVRHFNPPLTLPTDEVRYTAHTYDNAESARAIAQVFPTARTLILLQAPTIALVQIAAQHMRHLTNLYVGKLANTHQVVEITQHHLMDARALRRLTLVSGVRLTLDALDTVTQLPLIQYECTVDVPPQHLASILTSRAAATLEILAITVETRPVLSNAHINESARMPQLQRLSLRHGYDAEGSDPPDISMAALAPLLNTCTKLTHLDVAIDWWQVDDAFQHIETRMLLQLVELHCSIDTFSTYNILQSLYSSAKSRLKLLHINNVGEHDEINQACTEYNDNPGYYTIEYDYADDSDSE